ncbi:hypothetical protein H0264_18575 [Nocardia huaxiensis]|uniref:Uncharacterized protein n=1 Tax=Nocardia huaxiensis TaxID=2755382 RepID=A0A7D6Z621_9NOCA|nr:hypothetical protein [Nocardia huaxiensis]QLY33966.1 hypothetical protein H0264_18575 [Nocardia huaxiensis]
MTTEIDPVEKLVDEFTTFVTELADMTVKERRAFALDLLDPVVPVEFSDGALRGLWLALMFLTRRAPGSEAALGRRLLAVDQQLPEHLRWLTADRDDLTGPVAAIPDDTAAEAYQRCAEFDPSARTHACLATVNRVIDRAENLDRSLI